MKTAHTVGPWKTERRSSCTHIVSESQKGIHGWQSHITTLGDHIEYDGEPCGAVEGQDKAQAEIDANANLIAAAPELLAALEALKEWGCTHTSPAVGVTITPDNSPHDLLVAACGAIAKAKGGAE